MAMEMNILYNAHMRIAFKIKDDRDQDVIEAIEYLFPVPKIPDPKHKGKGEDAPHVRKYSEKKWVKVIIKRWLQAQVKRYNEVQRRAAAKVVDKEKDANVFDKD